MQSSQWGEPDSTSPRLTSLQHTTNPVTVIVLVAGGVVTADKKVQPVPERGRARGTHDPAPVTMATLFWRRRRGVAMVTGIVLNNGIEGGVRNEEQ